MILRVAFSFLIGTLLVLSASAQPPSEAIPRSDALGDPLPDGAVARLGTTRFKHSPGAGSTLMTALFALDGKRIVTLDSAASIRLWDAKSGKELPGPWQSNRYAAVAVSSDGSRLAAAADGLIPPGLPQRELGPLHIVIYDIATAKLIKDIFPNRRSFRALAFADKDEKLVIAGQGSVNWWSATATHEQWTAFYKETRVIDGQKQIKTFDNCALTPDGKSLAVQVIWKTENERPAHQKYEAIDQEAVGFDLASGEITWRAFGKRPPGENNPMAFSADGKRVAVVMEPHKVEVRDTTSGKLIAAPLHAKFPGEIWFGGVALSADGSKVALAVGNGSVTIWDLKDASAPRQFTARKAQFGNESTRCLRFSPDDKTLLIGVDADVQLYDVTTLKEVLPWEGHRGWLDDIAFSADGKRLLTGSAALNLHAQELAAWNVKTWKRTSLISTATPPWPNLAIVSPEQTYFVGKSGAERFRLYDVANGRQMATFNVRSNQAYQSRSFFSPSGKHFILDSQGSKNQAVERLYDVPSGRLLCELPALSVVQTQSDATRPIAFSSDERRVALLGRDGGTIHVCETATGKVLHRLMAGAVDDNLGRFTIANLAFSQDGKLLASWLGSSVFRGQPQDIPVRIWDLATGKERLQISTGTANIRPGLANRMRAVPFAWSPDSRVLAIGQDKIRLFEIATRGLRLELPGHENAAVRALAFSPDGRILTSGSSDTTVLIWDLAAPVSVGAKETTIELGELSKRWQVLAESDANNAYATMRALAAAPKETVPWIKERIKPAAPIMGARVTDLIGQLSSEQFNVRQKAMAELLGIGERIVPALDKALAANLALETSLRLQDLRKRFTGQVLKGEPLQTVRALEVLEMIGTSEARQVLQAFANGAPEAPLTLQAQGALQRLGK